MVYSGVDFYFTFLKLKYKMNLSKNYVIKIGLVGIEPTLKT